MLPRAPKHSPLCEVRRVAGVAYAEPDRQAIDGADKIFVLKTEDESAQLPQHVRHLARTYRLAKPSLGCATGVLVLQVECRSDRARRSPRAERSAGAME